MDKDNYNTGKDAALAANVLPKLANIEKNLKDQFLNGDLSVVDFSFYETLKFIQGVDAKALDTFPKIKAMMVRFENLDGVKELVNSEQYKKMQKMPEAYVPAGFNNGL